MLIFKDISIKYNGQKEAVTNFNIQIQKSEIVVIVGESGSGKTTAIRSAIGLISGNGVISKGQLFFNDEIVNNYTNKDWQKLRGEKISMIFQDAGSMLNPIRTIGSQFVQSILSHKKHLTKKDCLKLANEMLTKMGLSDTNDILKSYPFNLSGGQKQRVGIAMAMIFNPLLLIADEPTSALDVTTQSQIIRQMIELRDSFGTTILMTTHNLAVATYIADKIVVMQNGKIVEVGTSDEILNNPKTEYTKQLLNAIPDRGSRYV